MGIDLKVLASHFRERRGGVLPAAPPPLDRDAGLFAQLAIDAEPRMVKPLPEGLKVGHYEEEGLKFEETDRHGNRLTFTTPAELRNLRGTDDLSPWNRAVFAFLLALPPD